MTVLSDINKAHSEENTSRRDMSNEAQPTTTTKEQEGEDWFNSIGTLIENNSVHAFLADRAYERIKKSVTGENCLVDHDRLNVLGVNFLGDTPFSIGTSKASNSQELFLCMFCNLLGLSCKTLRCMIAQSHDMERNKSKKRSRDNTKDKNKSKTY